MKKKRILFILCIAIASLSLMAQDFNDILPEVESAAPTSAAALIAEGLSRLPKEPLTMEGEIIMRRPRGFVTRKLNFKVNVEWGAVPPVAVYEIYDGDNNGKLLETVTATAGEQHTLTRTTGEERSAAEPPAWNERIQETDVTWLDVTMAFLWWDKPVLSGVDTVLGRTSDRVDLFPPMPIPNCAKVSVWLDREVKLLLQAEEYNAQNKLNRKLWVRSVKKIHDRWMVRNIEVETRGTRHRTLLHVADVYEQPGAKPEP